MRDLEARAQTTGSFSVAPGLPSCRPPGLGQVGLLDLALRVPTTPRSAGFTGGLGERLLLLRAHLGEALSAFR